MSINQKKCVGSCHIKPNVRRKLKDLTRFVVWKSSSNKQQNVHVCRKHECKMKLSCQYGNVRTSDLGTPFLHYHCHNKTGHGFGKDFFE